MVGGWIIVEPGRYRYAIDWSDELLRRYLTQCMFSEDAKVVRNKKIKKIADLLGKQSTSKSHNRHISPDKAEALGINVSRLESDDKLQDIVLTLHHALTHSFTQTPAVKIIENHLGIAYVSQMQAVRVR